MDATDLKALLGVAIKAERSLRGFSQEELAERAGLHRTYVSDVERGARNPSVESVEKLARALNLSVATLFAQASNARTSGGALEILLVEDDPKDVQHTTRMFEKMRIKNPLHVVSDGTEALDFLFATGSFLHRSNATPPGIVLLDLNLPNRSGLEVLRRIKSDEATKNISVIVLTASGRDRNLVECRKLGVETYMIKPVDFHNLSKVTPLLGLAWTLVAPKETHSTQPTEGIFNRPDRFGDAFIDGAKPL